MNTGKNLVGVVMVVGLAIADVQRLLLVALDVLFRDIHVAVLVQPRWRCQRCGAPKQ